MSAVYLPIRSCPQHVPSESDGTNHQVVRNGRVSQSRAISAQDGAVNRALLRHGPVPPFLVYSQNLPELPCNRDLRLTQKMMETSTPE